MPKRSEVYMPVGVTSERTAQKVRLIHLLGKCAESVDQEEAHHRADQALLEFIGDEEIAAAYNKVPKWYA